MTYKVFRTVSVLHTIFTHSFAKQTHKKAMTGSSELLKPLNTFPVNGIERFSASEKFQTNETSDGVKIAYLGKTFRDRFGGMIETDIEPIEITDHDLQQPATDLEILFEFGGERVGGISLAHFYLLLKRQGVGQEEGRFLVNGDENFCYISGPSDRLLPVYCKYLDGDQYTGGWYIYASPVLQEVNRKSGNRIFLRDPS